MAIFLDVYQDFHLGGFKFHRAIHCWYQSDLFLEF